MSKRMVDLKVADGKIASINGYEVGGSGGGKLYKHYIRMYGPNGYEGLNCFLTVVSSKNIVVDSSDKLDILMGNVAKPISCSGLLPNNDKALTSVLMMDWGGTAFTSKFYLADGSMKFYTGVGFNYYEDVVEEV